MVVELGPCETKKVKLKDGGQVIRINVDDFDPKLHAEVGEKKKPAAKPKAAPKAKE